MGTLEGCQEAEGGPGPKMDRSRAERGGQLRRHRGAPGLTPDSGQEEGLWPCCCTHMIHGQAGIRLTLQDAGRAGRRLCAWRWVDTWHMVTWILAPACKVAVTVEMATLAIDARRSPAGHQENSGRLVLTQRLPGSGVSSQFTVRLHIRSLGLQKRFNPSAPRPPCWLILRANLMG